MINNLQEAIIHAREVVREKRERAEQMGAASYLR